MKCSSMKLASRKEYYEKKQHHKHDKDGNGSSYYTTSQTHRYCFPFTSQRLTNSSTDSILKINNLTPPEDLRRLSTSSSSSISKPSKKRSHQKSLNLSVDPIKSPLSDREFCYETLETDYYQLLQDLDEGFVDHVQDEDADSLSNIQYEVHSDIEQLLLKTESTEQIGESKDNCDTTVPGRGGRRRRRKHNREGGGGIITDDVNEKSPSLQSQMRGAGGNKRRKSKTIKFPIISKPSTPQTEQVIRVDVTSNVSIDVEEEGDTGVVSRAVDMMDGRRGHQRELKGNFNEVAVDGGGGGEEDFVVRCRQLALRGRRPRNNKPKSKK